MPDWGKLVAEKLAGLRLPDARRDTICRELAAHLEEDFEQRRTTGATRETAREETLRLLADREGMKKALLEVESEDDMNQRTRGLWIPGLISLTISGLLLTALGKWGPRPQFVSLGAPFTLILYPAWLLSLPLFGALGAWLAKRAGAAKRERLLAGLFPVATMVAAFFLILPVAMVVDGIRIGTGTVLKGFALVTLNWILIPGLPLLLGAMPFLQNGGKRDVARA